MIYDRAEVMYGQLRDVLGDSVFVAFLRDYYARWALRHVDERAMRASAERASGRNLGWFFDQWVHHTGVMDYKLGHAKTTRDASGAWVTTVPVRRVGAYAHPMPLGVRTDSGWTFARMKAPYVDEVLTIRTTLEPREVRLDPYHLTWDWDRRNDVPWTFWGGYRDLRYVFDWPFLDQVDREKRVLRYRPTFWYSDALGGVVGFSERGNYLGFAHRTRLDLGFATKEAGFARALQFYADIDDGFIPSMRLAGGLADDLGFVQLGRRFERRAGARSRAIDLNFTGTFPTPISDDAPALGNLPELWRADPGTVDVALRGRWQAANPSESYWFARPSLLAGWNEPGAFGKAELALGRVQMLGENERASIRAYYGATIGQTPPERGLYLSARDPIATFDNSWWRPRGAVLKRPSVNWLPLGGPALRGFHWSEGAERAGAVNAEISRKLGTLGTRGDTAGVWLNLFGDAAAVPGTDVLLDGGPGIAIRGKLYDWPIDLRFDFPLYVSKASRAIDRGRAGRGNFAPRWSIAFSDIW